MYEDVVQRLQSLGYEVLEKDEWLINFAIDKVTWTIKNECNVPEIPDGLHFIAVDMVCGEFLFAIKGSGQLENFDVEAAVKSIKEGDTQITYAISDNSITLDGLIDSLIRTGRSQFVTYRRFVW
jgi:hypothetical protein